MVVQPIFLAPNLVRRPYRGGKRLAAFRGIDIGEEERVPEDWLASTTSVFGKDGLGLTMLENGRSLKDALAADPVAYLGPEHVETFGPDPGLLVKLLDAGQRLSVHLHPDRAFVRTHLKARYGKSEAWYILSAEPGAAIHMGFRASVPAAELRAVVEGGEGASLLENMNAVAVEPGDMLFVPGGMPHAIGAGIFMIELQEPSDLLVRLEWSGYAVAGMPSDLGLGFGRALEAVDRTAWTPARLEEIWSHARGKTPAQLPEAARAFFQLETVKGEGTLAPGFRVVIVTKGEGRIATDGAETEVRQGECWLLPYAAGLARLSGSAEIACCRPAAPDAARAADPGFATRPM
jgi:mannose-6-phosphate isomerase